MVTALIFTASWCTACKQQRSTFKHLEEYCSVEYIDIDTDHGKAVADEYHVMSVPTVIVGQATFDEGFKPHDYFFGTQRLDAYKKSIKELMK